MKFIMKSYPRMKPSPDQFLFLLAWLLLPYFGCQVSGVSTGPPNNVQCIPAERQALLKFKQGIDTDNCGLLTSWIDQEPNQDCCRWHGVHCDDDTGHVVMLHLGGNDFIPCLEGSVSPSLLELKRLEGLDLSHNYFSQPFPSFIGSLHSLKYLRLSHAGFRGEIPHQLANLSSLTSLDLSENYDLHGTSMGWLSHLTLLRDIDLSGIDLSISTDWMQSVNNLPHLRYLRMCGCYLDDVSLPSNSFHSSQKLWWMSNLTISSHLEHLNLSDNYLKGPILIAIQNKSSLSHLDLSGNGLEGPIPDVIFGKMQALSHLDLSGNELEGPIPDVIGNLKALEFLNLRGNRFLSGNIPDSLAQLPRLTWLDLSHNNLAGAIPPLLGELRLINLSYNRLSGPIPSTPLGFNSSHLEFVVLSHNHLTGPIPSDFQNVSSLVCLLLSHNELEGPIPNATFAKMYSLASLDLSWNSLNSGIPDSLALLPRLMRLDLSNNELTGIIPTRLGELSPLQDIDLSNNNLSGPIPPRLTNFSPEAFEGNVGLGRENYSLPLCCPQVEAEDDSPTDILDEYFYVGLYVSIGLGFYVGFFAFFGTLALKDSWRHRYFQFLDHIINWVFVAVAIHIAKFQRNRETVPH